MMQTAQQLIYQGAGCPEVRDPDGAPLEEADLGECAFCGNQARLRVKDCISSNYVVAKNLRLGAQGFCKACGFCLRDLRLRCAPWFAREDGVRFCLDRWGILDFLLNPPEPPFAAGVPWFGISKGGLKNWQFARVWHPDREAQELSPAKVDEATGEVTRAPQVMGRLQSKHTAIFAQVGASREVYPIAVDDNGIFEVNVKLWRRLAAQLTEALTYIPVPCLEEWRPADGGAQWRHGIIHWSKLTAPFEPYRRAQWWPLLLAIVPRPERPEVEEEHKKPTRQTKEPSKATPELPRVDPKHDSQLQLF